jgi:hypothetical protein
MRTDPNYADQRDTPKRATRQPPKTAAPQEIGRDEVNLMQRAKQDARDRDKERRAKEREKRKAGKAEFEALTEDAAVFVSRKLDMEIAPSDLKHQEQTWMDGDDMAWDLAVETFDFEVARKNESGRFTLHQKLDPNDPESAFKYIKRLADLVPGRCLTEDG